MGLWPGEAQRTIEGGLRKRKPAVRRGRKVRGLARDRPAAEEPGSSGTFLQKLSPSAVLFLRPEDIHATFNPEGLVRRFPDPAEPGGCAPRLDLSRRQRLGWSEAITLDAAGAIHLLGYTNSPDFPLRDPLPIKVAPSWEFHVGNVTKLNPRASEVLFSAFLDGTGGAMGTANGIAVDAAGSIHVTGISNDPDFPVVGPASAAQALAKKGQPDATGLGTAEGIAAGTAALRVRASRAGGGDGRIYHLTFTATDPQGASCTGTVTVCVPHDCGKRSACVDGGPLVDSYGGR